MCGDSFALPLKCAARHRPSVADYPQGLESELRHTQAEGCRAVLPNACYVARLVAEQVYFLYAPCREVQPYGALVVGAAGVVEAQQHAAVGGNGGGAELVARCLGQGDEACR